MKKFNIILILCLALISIFSACSKDEDSPYTREQVIGKWVEKSYMEVDKYGNETWIDITIKPPFYYQFNANGTFYTAYVFDDRNSSWELKGTKIYAKTTSYGSDNIINSVFDIFSLSDKELIIKTKGDYSNVRKIKYTKDITK